MNTKIKVPLWRQILRGFSQCAFQTNEIAGGLFIAWLNPRFNGENKPAKVAA